MNRAMVEVRFLQLDPLGSYVLTPQAMVAIMNSSIVIRCSVNANKPVRALVTALLVLASGVVVAEERSISKSGDPSPVLVLSNSDTHPGVGFASFSVVSSDFPPGTLIDPKQLVEIQWSTTFYPDSIREDVRLCYSRPFSSQEDCRRITPRSSGTVQDFNTQSFGNGSRVRIYHDVYGGTPRYTRPAGVDSVVLKYSY